MVIQPGKLAFFWVLLLSFSLTHASNEAQRIALVIGNAGYQDMPLKNPANDARDMSAALTALGFQVVTKIDATQEEMEDAISYFGSQLGAGGVGLFYYAGHGVQVNGANYLIPLKARIKREKDVRYKAVDINQVLDEMGSANNGLNMVILDACRDNPLPRSFRSGQKGLAKMDGPKGTIIAYATGPGSTAMDGRGQNGVYTKHLLKAMRQPGLTVEDVFKQVLKKVDRETGGDQTPWVSSSFTGEFSFTLDMDERGLVIKVKPIDPLPEEVKQGAVNISTEPSNAVIRLEGAIAGHAPMSLNLDPGFYNISASLAGYETTQEKVWVQKGTPNNLQLILKPPQAKPVIPAPPQNVVKRPVPALDRYTAKMEIINYYRDKGQWKNVFMISKINKIRVLQRGRKAVVHARYRYVPVPKSRRSDSGTDTRKFFFRWNGKSWKLHRMGGHKSGKI